MADFTYIMGGFYLWGKCVIHNGGFYLWGKCVIHNTYGEDFTFGAWGKCVIHNGGFYFMGQMCNS